MRSNLVNQIKNIEMLIVPFFNCYYFHNKELVSLEIICLDEIRDSNFYDQRIIF
jgi:hypothetical protein